MKRGGEERFRCITFIVPERAKSPKRIFMGKTFLSATQQKRAWSQAIEKIASFGIDVLRILHGKLR